MNKEGSLQMKSGKAGKRVLWRWIFTSSVSSNYEKMQALAYCYAMLPFLKVIYKDQPDKLKASVINHLQFFNTNPWLAPYILGINVAMEENPSEDTNEAVTSIKTGLMGPLAGIGDSLFVVIPWTIFGAIAANLAIKGNPAGIFLWIAVSVALKLVSFPLFRAGYVSGTKLVETLQSSLKLVTESSSILGLMVVGALIPTVVKAHIALAFHQGNFTMKGSTILNQIMPGMIPALLVFGVYVALKKNVKPIWLILIVMVLSIVLYACGILK
ncbi:PTS system mannose/fructose/sorbose family transporter subunit IID [Limosilactobacillus sp.]|uniref:PTS system mannose/fructose/sorbose family transporter subunit IID n=1 Tax=Limosilactobacillus sp. TaxID=2773925 RepID=UPI00345EF8B6